ncbi:MAG: hypothetical protein U1A78_36620 [Polyangia bacterium]
MLRPVLALVVVLLAALSPRVSRACASCGCGDPTLTAMGIEKPFKNRVRLSLEQRFGGHSDPDRKERTLISRSTLSASWSPTAWLTLAAALPLAAGELRTLRASGPTARRVVGLGDLELYTRALVFRDRAFSPRHIVGILAGLKAPTGPRVADSSGYPAPDDFQPGSGSWDPLFGASYGYFGRELGVFASLSYRHTTTGRLDYRRGSVLGASALVQRSLHRAVSFGLGLELSHTRPDELRGISLPDTGGTVLAVAPQALIALRTDWLLRAALQIPVGPLGSRTQVEFPTGILALVVDL